MASPSVLVPAALALASAACLAFALVLARIGLRQRPVVAAAATSVPTATALMWLASPFALDTSRFDATAAGVFAGCGVLFPIGVTLLSFETNRRMGPALAGALGNLTPLFALGFAAALLGEHITPARGLGAGVVVLGVAVLLLRGGRPAGGWPLATLWLPVAQALIRGMVQPGIKAGLALWPSPFAAALIGYSVSSAIVLALNARRPAAAVPWRERAMFMAVGVCNAASVMLMYFALGVGSVSLVAPLVAGYPLFTLGFSALLLRHEPLGPAMLGGIALTVGGIALVLAG